MTMTLRSKCEVGIKGWLRPLPSLLHFIFNVLHKEFISKWILFNGKFFVLAPRMTFSLAPSPQSLFTFLRHPLPIYSFMIVLLGSAKVRFQSVSSRNLATELLKSPLLYVHKDSTYPHCPLLTCSTTTWTPRTYSTSASGSAARRGR